MAAVISMWGTFGLKLARVVLNDEALEMIAGTTVGDFWLRMRDLMFRHC